MTNDMKKLILASVITIALGACGGNTNSNENDSDGAMTEVEEQQVADSLVDIYSRSQKEINTSTEETLSEVDSLLENL